MATAATPKKESDNIFLSPNQNSPVLLVQRLSGYSPGDHLVELLTNFRKANPNTPSNHEYPKFMAWLDRVRAFSH